MLIIFQFKINVHLKTLKKNQEFQSILISGYMVNFQKLKKCEKNIKGYRFDEAARNARNSFGILIVIGIQSLLRHTLF